MKTTAKSTFYTLVIILLVTALNLIGCKTPYPKTDLSLVTEGEYYSTIEANTQKVELYDGFYATLQYYATILNTKVAKQQLDHQARIFQWDQETYNSEYKKLESDLKKQTEVFVSFYVPERKHDNLAKKKTMWKVFLDVDGRRFEGKPARIKAEFSEIHSNYPDHNRWATPYKIAFPVAASLVDYHSAKLTITGPVGSGSVVFEGKTPKLAVK